MKPVITDKYEMSYIRKMGNPKTHKTENELIIILPVGCYWAKKTDGCSYCGYQTLVDEMRTTTAPYTYVEILQTEIKKYAENIDRISFFVGGSFFEIPYKESIKDILDCLGNKKLQIAFGVESSNEYIRNQIHKKGLDENTYIKAMNILLDLNVHVLIYVFVKPPIPYITDDEAIDDAMKTIKDSFDKGAYAVELECGYIVENSDMYNLYKNGRYKPLSFWSIQKLLKNAIALNRGIVRLAYFSDTPKPIAGPSNCEKCNDKFIKMFDEYRETLDPKVLFEEIQCECKKYIIR